MSITLKLPKVFKSKIEGHDVESKTLAVLSTASQIIGDPTIGLTFFPEFTDHATPHFQRVLNSSASILNNDALDKMTPEDVYVLTAAVLLHDIAMHLNEDGFIQIVKGGWCTSTEWPALWTEFVMDAEKWNAKKLDDVLGNKVNPVSNISLQSVVQQPIPLDSSDTWTKQQRKLIGEFIRKHHALLAQEFALFGFPGKDRPIRLIQNGCKHDYLVGFIARSHHLSLRDTFSTLEEKYHGKIRCLDTHPVLLMAALRIADYLDVESERAPSMSLSLRSIHNPISKKEWCAHQAIDDLRIDEKDSEALFVLANPKDLGTYLRLHELFTDIQKELDLTWAVLGEIFSLQPDLKSVGLTIRRLKSNFDNESSLRNSLIFIPKKFQFHTAGAKLMNKLVGPLYEDQIEVGIRELIQNSIDATQELHKLTDEPLLPIRAGIKADSKEFIFEIEDFGIGMNEDVLQNYFLCAGASFRDSETWKRNFEIKNTPNIARSGRFGIGVLAGFLLGERITVTTRHYQTPEDQALTFSASIDDEFIEYRKIKRQNVGTKITISISEEIYKRLAQDNGLEWDWYRWNSPQIERYIDTNSSLAKVTPVPMPGEELPDDWHQIESQEFGQIFWTHGKGAAVVCNGITIGRCASSRGYNRNLTWENRPNRIDLSTPVSRPNVAVVDRNGVFPLSLQRFNTIEHAIPFRDELLADVTRDFIAFCLVFAPEQLPGSHNRFSKYSFLNYPGESEGPLISFNPSGHWFYSSYGTGVQHVTSLPNLAPSKVTLIISLDKNLPLPEISFRPDHFYFFGATSLDIIPMKTIPMVLAHSLGFNIKNLGPHPQFFTKSENASVFLKTNLAQYCSQYIDGQIDLTSVNLHSIGGAEIDILHKSEEAPPMIENLSPQVCEGVRQGNYIAAEISNPSVEYSANPIFDEIWSSYMEDEIIPYKQSDRSNKFVKAFKELDEYITKWKSLQSRGIPYISEVFRTKGPNGENLQM